MSLKINAKTTEETLSDKFEKDSKLLGSMSGLLSFAASITSGEPLGIAAGAALIVKTAGDAIAAGTSVIKRLGASPPNDSSALLPSYDRFRVEFYVTCQKCFIEALESTLSAYQRKRRTKKPEIKQPEINQLKEQLKMQIANLYEAEVSYLFCVEPLDGSVPLYEAFARWTISALTFHGFTSHDAHEVGTTVEKEARKRFHVLLASKDASAEWMRSYLAITQRSESSTRLFSDLAAIRDTLANWTDSTEQLKQNRKKAWCEYREALLTLPDQKETMFGEDFGVRKVFIQPRVDYHLQEAIGNAGKPHPVSNLGRLLGALISSRVSGEDLVILCGGPGSGKSTLCRIAASELAANPEIHPVFLRLRRVKEGAEIAQFIEESLQKFGLINRLSDLKEVPNLVLILDGFDELVMASRARLRHFFNVLREDLSSGALRKAKAIVSGRDTLFPRGEGLPLGSHVLSLRAFDKNQIKGWGAKWRQMHKSGPGSSFHPEELIEGSDEGKKPPLHHLASWPLTLHLVARVHTAGKLDISGRAGKQIEKAFLYRSILAETSSRQCEQTEGSGRLDSKKTREFLRALGWEMHSRSIDSMDPADVIPLLKKYYPDKTEVDLAELAEVAIVNSPELTKGEETGFEFVHKSFAEYLVGERFADLVERIAFKAPEFGEDDLTWRMSEQEAARELAPMLGIRLIPEEVQEMFEPMLGCFGPFVKGERVDEAMAASKRREGLTRIVERFEMLHVDFLRGISFETVGKVADANSLARTPLEAHANYCAGILIIGTAASRQLRQFSVKAKDRRSFAGEPFRGAFWRSICILATGGLALDESTAKRLLDGMHLQSSDQPGNINDLDSPIRFGHLSLAFGYDNTLSKYLEHALSYTLEIEHTLLGCQMLIRHLKQFLFPSSPDEYRHMFESEFIYAREKFRSPVLNMFMELLRCGFADGSIEPLIHESDAVYRHWIHDIEYLSRKHPRGDFRPFISWLERTPHFSRRNAMSESSRLFTDYFRHQIYDIDRLIEKHKSSKQKAPKEPTRKEEESV